MATIGKALGTEDVSLGVDAAFDERFIVRCDDAAEVRAVLSPDAMQTMLGAFRSARAISPG